MAQKWRDHGEWFDRRKRFSSSTKMLRENGSGLKWARRNVRLKTTERIVFVFLRFFLHFTCSVPSKEKHVGGVLVLSSQQQTQAEMRGEEINAGACGTTGPIFFFPPSWLESSAMIPAIRMRVVVVVSFSQEKRPDSCCHPRQALARALMDITNFASISLTTCICYTIHVRPPLSREGLKHKNRFEWWVCPRSLDVRVFFFFLSLFLFVNLWTESNHIKTLPNCFSPPMDDRH